MSDRSVYSGLYQQAREYAELVDRVLIGLKTNCSSPIDPERQKLGEFLSSLDRDSNTDLPSRMLILALTERVQLRGLDWKTIGQALLSNHVGTKVIEAMEEIAGSLEQAQASALNRIRT